jgi:mRNA-degrading endonuclease RelE of RelBE toxin-antitoxin system
MLFVETSLFSTQRGEWFSDDEYREMQSWLIERPDAGAIIRGSGGIRKIRWSAKGKGKSGGVRVIYYWERAPERIYLLTMYGKSERADIDRATLKRIAAKLELLDQ